MDAAIGSRSAKEIRELAKAKSKASSDSGGSSERSSITSSDNGSNEKKAQSPPFALNQIIAAINDVSNLTQTYETTKSEKLETKRMKYQVEEKQLALEESERQDRCALFENMVAQNNQNQAFMQNMMQQMNLQTQQDQEFMRGMLLLFQTMQRVILIHSTLIKL